MLRKTISSPGFLCSPHCWEHQLYTDLTSALNRCGCGQIKRIEFTKPTRYIPVRFLPYVYTPRVDRFLNCVVVYFALCVLYGSAFNLARGRLPKIPFTLIKNGTPPKCFSYYTSRKHSRCGTHQLCLSTSSKKVARKVELPQNAPITMVGVIKRIGVQCQRFTPASFFFIGNTPGRPTTKR